MKAYHMLFSNLTKSLKNGIKKIKIKICQSPYINCKRCQSEQIRKSDNNCVVFTMNGPKQG